MQQADFKQLRKEFVNPLAVMLPYMGKYQSMVYRQAQLPPGLEGYQPRWEIVNAVLLARQQVQVKVDLMTDFHLLALLGSATTNTLGGFRVQMYDILRKRRLQDRPAQFPNLGGAANAPFFLREPYRFDLPKSQMNLVLVNLEAVTNTVQIALYGAAAPFPGTLSNE